MWLWRFPDSTLKTVENSQPHNGAKPTPQKCPQPQKQTTPKHAMSTNRGSRASHSSSSSSSSFTSSSFAQSAATAGKRTSAERPEQQQLLQARKKVRLLVADLRKHADPEAADAKWVQEQLFSLVKAVRKGCKACCLFVLGSLCPVIISSVCSVVANKKDSKGCTTTEDLQRLVIGTTLTIQFFRANKDLKSVKAR